MIERPTLTFPDDVADVVRRSYQASQSVVEYGSGGSTVLAAELPNLACVSVESDRAWARGLKTWLDHNVQSHGVSMHYVDIGPTREWGWPARTRRRMAPWYAQYLLSVWRRGDVQDPDVVLIDGRFRVGCFLATLSRIKTPTKILFDDYVDRPRYHIVEQFFRPVGLTGRMAEFHVTPRRLSLGEVYAYARRALHPL